MRELTLAKLSFIFNMNDADAFDMDKPITIVDDKGNHYELVDVCSQGISFINNNITDKKDGIYLKKINVKEILNEMTENLWKDNKEMIMKTDA